MMSQRRHSFELLPVLLLLLTACASSVQESPHELTPAERARLEEACSLDWLIFSLEAGHAESDILAEAARRCLRFVPGDDERLQLSAAGASDTFLNQLDGICVITEDRLLARSNGGALHRQQAGYMLGYLLGAVLAAAIIF